jgi:hypothetical protein
MSPDSDPSPWVELFAFLASGAGTIILALLAGAGGSALLELFWKPRRDRRRAATLVLSEVAFNTELLLLQAHARFKNRQAIPADFALSTMGWDAAGDLVSELPVKMLRELVLLYNQFQSLNRHVSAFGDYLREFESQPKGSAERAKADIQVMSTIDVFNTGIDSTISNAQALLPELAKVAKHKDEKVAEAPDYEGRVAKLIGERQERLQGLLKKP